MKRLVRHKKKIASLFHICIDCFTVSHLGTQGVFVSNTMVKSIRGFSWNFQDMLAMTQGTTWIILGVIGLTPSTEGFFFFFSFFFFFFFLGGGGGGGGQHHGTSRNTGWMDIHEIFRIWIQEAKGYTASRLSRLFHARQTRRGGGFRSQSASCYIFKSWLHSDLTWKNQSICI